MFSPARALCVCVCVCVCVRVCVCVCPIASVQIQIAKVRIAKDLLDPVQSATTHSVPLADITGDTMPWLHTLFRIIIAQAEQKDAEPGFINVPGKRGFTALQLAAAFLDHQAMQIILELGGDPQQADDEWHLTPLHFAARNCDRPAVDMLLAHGGDKSATLVTPLRELPRDLVPEDSACDSLRAVLAQHPHEKDQVVVTVAEEDGGDDTVDDSLSTTSDDANDGNSCDTPTAGQTSAPPTDGGGVPRAANAGGWRPPSKESWQRIHAVPNCRDAFAVLDARTLVANALLQQHILKSVPAVIANTTLTWGLRASLQRDELEKTRAHVDVKASKIPCVPMNYAMSYDQVHMIRCPGVCACGSALCNMACPRQRPGTVWSFARVFDLVVVVYCASQSRVIRLWESIPRINTLQVRYTVRV